MADEVTYKGSGVDYDAMDPFKRMAQEAARETAANIARLGLSEVEISRGESAYLIEALDHYLAHVEEGLGTKNLVLEEMYRIPDDPQQLSASPYFYRYLAQDTVAMIVNDMITLGALPLSVAMHLAVGSSDWFGDLPRMESLVEGWKSACIQARCVWGGGETPTLKDVVVPGSMVLSGSAIGIIKPKSRLIRSNIRHGDAIVMLASSGVHANGLTLARQIGQRVGFGTRISDGRPFAEALLDPTHIYVPVIEDALRAGIKLHYCVNITGHGWRKLMRAVEPFVYVVSEIPEPQPVFRFIQENGPVGEKEMYGNYNMGAGFAVYVDPDDADAVVQRASQNGIDAWVAGHVEKRGDEKKVLVEPLAMEFDKTSLAVR